MFVGAGLAFLSVAGGGLGLSLLLFCDVGVAEGISYEAFFPPWFFSCFFVLEYAGGVAG